MIYGRGTALFPLLKAHFPFRKSATLADDLFAQWFRSSIIKDEIKLPYYHESNAKTRKFPRLKKQAFLFPDHLLSGLKPLNLRVSPKLINLSSLTSAWLIRHNLIDISYERPPYQENRCFAQPVTRTIKHGYFSVDHFKRKGVPQQFSRPKGDHWFRRLQ